MKLHLENIGKISKADVEINGITVIAGENNTGKSTVGKTLFVIFDSFYNIKKEIFDTRIRLFSNELKTLFDKEFDDYYDVDVDQIARILFNKSKATEIDLQYIFEIIQENVSENPDFDEYEYVYELKTEITDDFIKKIKALFEKYHSTSDEKICISILNSAFNDEFNLQINNLFTKSKNSNVHLEIKDKFIDIMINEDRVESLERNISSLNSEISYIDDPLIIDNTPRFFRSDYQFSFNSTAQYHKNKILVKLLTKNNINDIEKAFHDVFISERMTKVTNKINEICHGTLSYRNMDGFSYYDSDLETKFNSHNVSAGLKTFAIIKTLLTNGSLRENGTIILDEPEVHLHPEWQILLAEIIVMLQKEFNMHILLTTHSPYFLEAIEVYSQKYQIDNKCKYYLAENVGNVAEIRDVTDNTEPIYQKLANPFQDLENARYADHDD